MQEEHIKEKEYHEAFLMILRAIHYRKNISKALQQITIGGKKYLLDN